MRRFVHTVLLFSFLSIIPLQAQNSYTFRQFGNETIDFIKQPTSWNGDDWLRVGLASAGTFLVMQIDQPVRDAMLRDRSHYNSAPIRFGKFWGETYTTAAIAGAFGLHGILTKNGATRKVGFELAQAALYSGGITTVMKLALGRARPYTDEGTTKFVPFSIFDDGFHALPSGHCTLAFALSTVLSRNVDSGTLKVIAFVPAALTALSRIYQDYHWASDCVLGAVIGYVVATWVVDMHDSKDSPVQLTSVYPLTIRINF
jgi:membrane-associated phospholipid phosphatase